MTLLRHIMDNPTQELGDIQAHSVDTKAMVTNKTMGLYIAEELYLSIHEIAAGNRDVPVTDAEGVPTGGNTPHPAKAICLLIKNTLADGSSDGGDFNFIRGTNKGEGIIRKTEEMRDVTLTEHAVEIQQLLDLCIWHCNQITYPFASVTQIEVDEIKAELALMGDQPVTAVTYLGNQDKHVKIANEDVRLTVRLDAPVTVDTVVDFTLLIRNSDDQEFSPVDNWLFQITVPSGSTTATREITNTRKLTRHTQFTAKSNVLNPFTVEVTGA